MSTDHLTERFQSIMQDWDKAIHSTNASARIEVFGQMGSFASDLIKALEIEVKERDSLRDEMKEAAERISVLQSQVDNSDMNLAQVRKAIQSKVRKLEDALGQSQHSLAQQIFRYEERLTEIKHEGVVGEWQPISTIPFGVPVLVTNGKIATCMWLCKRSDKDTIHHSHGWRGDKWDFTFNPDTDLTHWMPLPEVPSNS